MQITNPYRVGPWVVGNEFYSRGGLLQDIRSGPVDSLWIIGNRRVGKTSLLRAVEHQAANSPENLPLFWDLQGDTSEAQLIESFLEAVEDAQWHELDRRWSTLVMPETVRSISKALRHVAAHARHHHCRLLLLCDEIEGLNQIGQSEPHVLSGLRRVMQHNPMLRAVLASTRRLSRLYAIQSLADTSLFLEGFEPRYLTSFDDDTANQVICRTQSDQPLRVDEALMSQLRHFSGNHPLILQKICSQLFDPSSNALHPFNPTEFVLDDQLSGTFQQDFDSLTPDEARLLLAINTQSLNQDEIFRRFPDISTPTLRRILHDLSRLGFLCHAGETFQAGNIPLGQWLATGPTHNAGQGGVTNHMTRQVAQERVTALQRQLLASYRRLGHLEVQQAKMGNNTPPEIRMEIEDYREQISEIESELAELGQKLE